MQVENRKPTFKGPADWFTGDVFVDHLTEDEYPGAS